MPPNPPPTITTRGRVLTFVLVKTGAAKVAMQIFSSFLRHHLTDEMRCRVRCRKIARDDSPFIAVSRFFKRRRPGYIGQAAGLALGPYG
jgi:hypothetical protein